MFSSVGLSLAAGKMSPMQLPQAAFGIIFYRITCGFLYEFRVIIAVLGSLKRVNESIKQK
jgi:hypothetical protein